MYLGSLAPWSRKSLSTRLRFQLNDITSIGAVCFWKGSVLGGWMGQRERHTVKAHGRCCTRWAIFHPLCTKGSPHIVGTSEWVWLGSWICTEVLLQGRRNKGGLAPPPPSQLLGGLSTPSFTVFLWNSDKYRYSLFYVRRTHCLLIILVFELYP